MREKTMNKFKEIFGGEGEIKSYFAPGRVNLIGEHTDYNGGHVFPCALTIGTYAVARKREDSKLRFYSMNFEELGVIESDIRNIEFKEEDKWTNFPKGVIWTFDKHGLPVDKGLDIVLNGNIPNGSGLSSSASVEVVIGVILKDMFEFDIDMIQIAKLSQYSENNFNGVNSGIMDQFAVAMGKKDHAIFLDTADLSYEYAPIHLEDAKIVIASSNKKRALADSKYNERRSECETALKELQSVVDIKSLGELTEEEFEKSFHAIKDPIRVKRAKHAVAENQRTIRAVAELKEGNIAEFGRLMNASHLSLKDDYEVTGIELDTLVEAAWAQEGVIGSRMTGAGFGGCTVSLVKNDKIDEFIQNVGDIYKEKIGYAADFYVVEIGPGAGILE